MEKDGIRYVRLDPEGNITCLVLSPVPREDRGRVTAALMDRCEQVGYLTSPEGPEAEARLEMMGGEFCGNAAMATAAWLTAGKGGEEAFLRLEVSGAEKPVACRVWREGADWRASVEMPLPLGTEPFAAGEEQLDAVYLPGMAHLIRTGESLDPGRAEQLLRAAAEELREPAAGLLQWQEERTGTAADGTEISGRMIPLIWVRDSGTLVWEHACGSGTAAVACRESARRKASARVRVRQPGGGLLTAETRWGRGGIEAITLSGRIRLGEPAFLEKEAGRKA